MNKKLPIKRFDTQYFEASKIYVFVQLIDVNQLINTWKKKNQYKISRNETKTYHQSKQSLSNNTSMSDIFITLWIFGEWTALNYVELFNFAVELSANFNAVENVDAVVAAVFIEINMRFIMQPLLLYIRINLMISTYGPSPQPHIIIIIMSSSSLNGNGCVWVCVIYTWVFPFNFEYLFEVFNTILLSNYYSVDILLDIWQQL